MDKALKSVLDWWDAAGVDVPDVTLSAPKRKTPARAKPAATAKRSAPQTTALKPIIEAAPVAAKAKTLAELKTLWTVSMQARFLVMLGNVSLRAAILKPM